MRDLILEYIDSKSKLEDAIREIDKTKTRLRATLREKLCRVPSWLCDDVDLYLKKQTFEHGHKIEFMLRSLDSEAYQWILDIVDDMQNLERRQRDYRVMVYELLLSLHRMDAYSPCLLEIDPVLADQAYKAAKEAVRRTERKVHVHYEIVERQPDQKDFTEALCESLSHEREVEDETYSFSLDEFTSMQRQVLELVKGGQSYREIARTLDVHLGTVHKHIHRAKKRLNPEAGLQICMSL